MPGICDLMKTKWFAGAPVGDVSALQDVNDGESNLLTQVQRHWVII